MEEKRKARRVKEKAEATLKVICQENVPGSAKIVHQVTKDISLLGMRIESDAFLPVNSMLRIELFLQCPTKLITAYGRAKWIKCLGSDLFEIGIEFVETPKDVIQSLKTHFERLVN